MQDIKAPVPPVGSVLSGFEVLSHQELPEYRSIGVSLRHRVTGMEAYHVVCDDPENVFAFAFLTPPKDSTGVAHILEHTVLCGSKHYPLKDPFLVLMKGSMSTFLNALTYPDKTVYPAASPNKKDLFNIMRVYGDAVFFPLLSKEMFAQEGHRLEFDDDGKLIRTGIVFNEMKGNYSNHDSIAGEWSLRSVLPETTYGYDSGGDPKEIPNLTYEDFVDFHRNYYHPSNCRLFLYGDTPTAEYCDLVESEFLRHFDGALKPASVTVQAPWSAPRRLTKTAPVAAEEPAERQTSVTLNWLLGEVTDPLHTLTAEAINEILVGHSGSPLYQAVSESDIGDDLSSPTGLETEVRQLIFSAGIRGTEAERVFEVEALIIDVLTEQVREGLDPTLVQGALNKIEFRNREIRGGGPYGLRMMRRLLRGWVHGTEPERSLRFRDTFDQLKARMDAHPRYLEAFIEHHLIDNPHRSTLIVVPDPEQEHREILEEEAALRSLAEALAPEAHEEIRKSQTQLRAVQEEPDPPEIVAALPFLTRGDLPREVDVIDYRTDTLESGEEVMFHDFFTNGVVYVDLAIDLAGIDPELLLWMPLFSGFLSELGVRGLDYSELHRLLALHTGGLSFNLNADGDPGGSGKVGRYLTVRMKLLSDSLKPGFDLLRRILFEPSLDNSRRMVELFREAVNDARSSIVPGGTSYAALRTAAALAPSAALDEKWKGITQLEHISQLSKRDDAVEELQKAMSEIHREILDASRWSASITAEGKDHRSAAAALGVLTAGLRRSAPGASTRGAGIAPGPGIMPGTTDLPLVSRGPLDAFEIPAAVNFTALTVKGHGYGDPDYATQRILGHVLRTGRLWEAIRMRGGAYGAYAMTRGFEGLFTLASYRDPNVAATLAAFREALELAAKDRLDDRSLELAVVSTVGRDSRPMAPGEKGYTSFRRRLLGVTDGMRQAQRDRLLGLGAGDVADVARRLAGRVDEGYGTIFGGTDAIDAAEKELPVLKDNRRGLRI